MAENATETAAPVDAALPLLLSENIQGNILAPFNKPYQRFLFISFMNRRAEARDWLRELVGDGVASTKQVVEHNEAYTQAKKNGRTLPTHEWVGVSFTSSGLVTLDPGLARDLVAYDAFWQGPLVDREYRGQRTMSPAVVGDVRRGDPTGLGRRRSGPVPRRRGGDRRGRRRGRPRSACEATRGTRRRSGGLAVLSWQDCRRRPTDEGHAGDRAVRLQGRHLAARGPRFHRADGSQRAPRGGGPGRFADHRRGRVRPGLRRGGGFLPGRRPTRAARLDARRFVPGGAAAAAGRRRLGGADARALRIVRRHDRRSGDGDRTHDGRGAARGARKGRRSQRLRLHGRPAGGADPAVRAHPQDEPAQRDVRRPHPPVAPARDPVRDVPAGRDATARRREHRRERRRAGRATVWCSTPSWRASRASSSSCSGTGRATPTRSRRWPPTGRIRWSAPATPPACSDAREGGPGGDPLRQVRLDQRSGLRVRALSLGATPARGARPRSRSRSRARSC